MEVSNVKAMREALEAVYRIAYTAKNDFDVFAGIERIRRISEAALAAPPRNCDRFGGDYKMLHTAWFDWTGSPSGQNPDGTVKLTFAKWLLAPATEQKGGAK